MRTGKLFLLITILFPLISHARLLKTEKRYVLWPYASLSLKHNKRVKIKQGAIISVKNSVEKQGVTWLRFYYRGRFLYIKRVYTHPIPHKPLILLNNLKNDIDSVDIGPGNPCIYRFKPKNLIKVPVYHLGNRAVYLRKKAAFSFFKMARDAELEGLSILAYRGFVSAKKQAKKYYKSLNIYEKREYFPDHIAKPVTNNLQTGVCVDVTSSNVNYKCEYQFFFSKEYKWLIKNSHKYGFYPAGGSKDYFDFKPYRFRFYYNEKNAVSKTASPDFKLIDVFGIAKLHVMQKGKLNITYFKIHDSETTAAKTIKYLYNRYGGRYVDLINAKNLNSRYLTLKVRGRKYRCDPNRIFTDVGVDKLKRFNSFFEDIDYAPAKKLIRKIRKSILSVLNLNSRTPFIYVHTNKFYSRLTVYYLHDISRKVNNIFDVYINKALHIKSFVYVLQRQDFKYFSNLGINTIRQKKAKGIDDGSLSIYAEKYVPNLSYATVETINEDAKGNKYLADKVIRYFIKKHGLKISNED